MDVNSWGNVDESGSRRVDEMLGGGDGNNFWKDWVTQLDWYGCCE